MRTSVSLYHRHRFPAEVISHCVWSYFRFALSFRDVEEMLAMRGVSLSYETVREWCRSSVSLTPTACAASLLDLVTAGISTKCSSKSTDSLITFGVRWTRMAMSWMFWSKANATRRRQRSFFVSSLKGCATSPRAIVTDKLRSYGAARSEVMPSVEHVPIAASFV